LADEDMEETIARWMQRICGQQQSFQVVLNNFSGSPSDAVFVRVQNPGPFQNLAKHLHVIDSYVRSNGFPPARLISSPHLTVARRLPEDVYTKAMFDYAHREFHGSFVVRELVLLKRKHQLESGERINVFRFLPDVLPVSYSTQPNIF
jgi:2'-5' RNA ligase